MGKKPVLGIVSAFCVGLALTGCRDANTRSEGVPPANDSKPAYQTHSTFGPGGTNTAPPTSGWNNAPGVSKATPATGGGMAVPDATPSMTGMKPADAPVAPRMDISAVQPAGATMTGPLVPPSPPAPIAPDIAPRAGKTTDWTPTPASSNKFAPSSEMPAPGRMLPPTPGLPANLAPLPPLPEPPAPIGPRAGEDTAPPPPPPLPTPKWSLPRDTPTPGPAPILPPAPMQLPPAPQGPAPLPPPPLPLPPG